jgi:predicted TIM-barrel fold metal-dependent hydrolase
MKKRDFLKSVLVGSGLLASGLFPGSGRKKAFGEIIRRKDFYRIDAYSHIMTLEYLDLLENLMGFPHPVRPMFEHVSNIHDVNSRLQLMDKTGIDLGILIANPSIESAGPVYLDPEKTLTAAQFCNNEIAAIVNDHPDRFKMVALLPTNDVNNMLGEFERCVKQLNAVGGWFTISPVLKPPDHPDYMQLYAKAVELDVPLWLHPGRPPIWPEYQEEGFSKYDLFRMLGWTHDTTVAMTRIAYANVFGLYPDVKIITHHHGSNIPLWISRLQSSWELYEERGVSLGLPPELSKPYSDHFKKFYVDTVFNEAEDHILQMTYDFYGEDHVLFATDCPFSVKNGEKIVWASRYNVEQLRVGNRKVEKIFSKNILNLIPG